MFTGTTGVRHNIHGNRYSVKVPAPLARRHVVTQLLKICPHSSKYSRQLFSNFKVHFIDFYMSNIHFEYSMNNFNHGASHTRTFCMNIFARAFFTHNINNTGLEKFPPKTLCGFAIFFVNMSGIVNASQNCHFNAVLQSLSNVHHVLTLLEEHSASTERQPSKLTQRNLRKIQMNYSKFLFFPTIRQKNTVSSYLIYLI